MTATTSAHPASAPQPPAPRPASGTPDPADPAAAAEGAAAGEQPHPYPYPYSYGYLEPKRDRFSEFVVRTVDRAPRWVGPLASAGGIGMAVAYTFLVRPNSVWAGAHSTCIVRILTGFDCPGCGGTRAAWYLMHGDLLEAARNHAPLVFATPFLVYMYLVWALNSTFGWNLPQLRLSTRSLMFFMAGWAVFSLLRDLPWAPFSFFYV
jgi:hypothetical protein